jgi:hypothetical protein
MNINPIYSYGAFCLLFVFFSSLILLVNILHPLLFLSFNSQWHLQLWQICSICGLWSLLSNLRSIIITDTTKYRAVKLGQQKGVIFFRSLMHCDDCDRRYAITDIHEHLNSYEKNVTCYNQMIVAIVDVLTSFNFFPRSSYILFYVPSLLLLALVFYVYCNNCHNLCFVYFICFYIIHRRHVLIY